MIQSGYDLNVAHGEVPTSSPDIALQAECVPNPEKVALYLSTGASTDGFNASCEEPQNTWTNWLYNVVVAAGPTFPDYPPGTYQRTYTFTQIQNRVYLTPPYSDLKTLEYHLLDTGHFALEEEGDTIARRMREFFGEHVAREGGGGDRKQQEAG